ncbi:MAG: glutathione S-transferase family protein [Rhodospirillaceae bacterium]|nr:glutathione S-transferase family protein [Rhodospirillaceae bacterium]
MKKPKLYMFSISPSCQRVFATLANKGIEYDSVEIDISERARPEGFEKISPFGKVPLLEHNGRAILESANIIQYIDEVWPDPPMMPSDPMARAYARQWIQFADRELFDRDAQFVHVEPDRKRKLEICSNLFDSLKFLDRELDGKKALFLGDDLSLVDCMLAPTLANAPVWSDLTKDRKYETYENVKSYTDRLRRSPVLEQTVFCVPIEVYESFFKAVLVDGMTFPPKK